MTDLTTKHDLPKPELSEQANGPAQIGALADALDEIIVAYAIGAAGSRPANPGTDGEGLVYIATDTEVVSIWDGDEWYDLNPKDAAAATASLRTLGTSGTSAAAGNDSRFNAAKVALGQARAAHSSNVNTSNPGTASLGGVTATVGDVILLVGQSAGAQNGPWVFQGTSSAMTRPTWYANASTARGGALVAVEEGTHADTLWQMTTNGNVTVDTTATAWSWAGGTDASRLSATETHTGDKTFSGALTANGLLTVGDRVSLGADTQTGSVTLTTSSKFRQRYTGSGGHTITLPAASGIGTRAHFVENLGTGVLTVARAGSDVLNGVLTGLTLQPGEAAHLVSNNSNTWDTHKLAAPGAGGVYTTNATATMPDVGYDEAAFYGSTASQTITLPPAKAGKRFAFTNTGSVNVTCGRAGSDSVGGTTSVVVAPGVRLDFVCVTDGVWRPQWPLGAQVASGYSAIATSSAGAGDKLSITVAGDGMHAMVVSIEAPSFTTSAGAGTSLVMRLRDGASGTGTVYELAGVHNAGSNYENPMCVPKKAIPSFTGSKTFYANLQNAAGTPSLNAASDAHAFIRATWAPGYQ